MEVSVPYVYLLGLILVAFAARGFTQGWAREGATFGGAFAAWLIIEKLGDRILEMVNRLARSVLFVLQGGIESNDPASLVRSLNQLRVVDPEHPQVPLTILFGVLVLIVYLLTPRFILARRTIPAKVGGSLIAIVNGYLIAFALLQEPSLQAKLIVSATFPPIGLPMGDIPGFSGQYVSAALVALVGIVIVLALFTGIRSSRRRMGSGWAEKRRS